MRHPRSAPRLGVLARCCSLGCVVVLVGCGGGGDPDPATFLATLRLFVSGILTTSTQYTSTDLVLSLVTKGPASADWPELCRFEFSGMRNLFGKQLAGEVAYRPGAGQLESGTFRVDGYPYTLAGPQGTTVDRDGSTVKFVDAAILPGLYGTVNGELPIRRRDRPAGC